MVEFNFNNMSTRLAEKNLIGKLNKISREELEYISQESSSLREILLIVRVDDSSGNYITLRRTLKELNIVFSPTVKKIERVPFRKKSMEELLVKGNREITHLRYRIIKEKVLEYKCQIKDCDNTGTWLGETISLQLDHIDGDRANNQIENLRFLCPNCHTQTETYGSRRIKGLNRSQCKENKTIKAKDASRKSTVPEVIFTREDLEADVKLQTVKEICEKYKVTTRVLKYWLKRYGLEYIVKRIIVKPEKPYIEKKEKLFTPRSTNKPSKDELEKNSRFYDLDR